MKIFVLLLTLFATHLCFGQQKEFIENVLDDFACRNCNFIALDVTSEEFTGKVAIENDDLYTYLEKTESFDKTQYKQYIQDLLVKKQPLVIKNSSLYFNNLFIKTNIGSDRAFRVVGKDKEIDNIASKGCQTFIKYYFLEEELESIKNSSKMTCDEFISSHKKPLRLKRTPMGTYQENAIINKLFEWDIAVSIRDISMTIEISYYYSNSQKKTYR